MMKKSLGEDVRRLFAAQSEHKWEAKVTSPEHRREQLRRLRAAVVERAGDLQAALTADMGKPLGDPYPEEVEHLLSTIDEAVENLEAWMEPLVVTPSPGFGDAEEAVQYEARGVCLLFGPWNFPFQLLFEPLVPMLAAGNTVIMKPNELAPTVSKVSAEIIRSTFDENDVAVVEGGVDVANLLLELPVDHIFFTGSPAVGKIIMTAAARHLASVTLELGGKCPAVVDRATNVAEAARTVAIGRHSNGGQLCLATDYALVHDEAVEEFLRHYNAWVDENLYSDGQLDPKVMTHIIDERNMARVLSYVDDARERGAVIARGGHRADHQPTMIEPAVVLQAPLDAKVMTEEIFGPVLPVQTFSDASEVVELVRAGTKPLAMYLFSDDRDFVDQILAGTSSGGVTVNGWGSHWAETQLPFGGVNHSGIGRYHGVHGFRELSHERSVVRHRPLGGADHSGSNVTDGDALRAELAI